MPDQANLPVPQIACIIDDDPIYVFGTKRLLQRSEIVTDISTFSNGDEAIKHFMEHGCNNLPHVILLDINMPVMDGWQFLDAFSLLRQQRDCFKHVRLYMVSSSIHQEDIDRANAHPLVHGYVIKPISMPRLRQLFEEPAPAM